MGRRRTGAAAKIGLGEEIVRRGLMAVNALRRIVGSGGLDGMKKQLAKERKYFDSHRKLSKLRKKVRELMDQNAEVYGRKLGFYLGPNENHCSICISMNGKNFYADREPKNGYPGMVHPNCNCSAGAPFPNAPMLR